LRRKIPIHAEYSTKVVEIFGSGEKYPYICAAFRKRLKNK
jgi:hypothetical protein